MNDQTREGLPDPCCSSRLAGLVPGLRLGLDMTGLITPWVRSSQACFVRLMKGARWQGGPEQAARLLLPGALPRRQALGLILLYFMTSRTACLRPTGAAPAQSAGHLRGSRVTVCRKLALGMLAHPVEWRPLVPHLKSSTTPCAKLTPLPADPDCPGQVLPNS